MISRTRQETSKVKGAIQKAVNYELTIADMARRSEKRAWQVAVGALVLCAVLAAGYFFLLPLKERTPFLVLVDPYSGNVQTSRLVPDVLDRTITASEAISRANVQRFVLARESYDWATLNRRFGDWQTAYLMSSSSVGAQIREEYATKNPGSPLNLFGKTDAIRIQLLSTTVVGSGRGKNAGTATVRFQRSVFNKPSGTLKFLDNKLATLTFKYNDHLRLDDNQRVVNPLGFQVLSYKVDNDYVASPRAVVNDAEAEAAVAGASASQAAGQVPFPGSQAAPASSVPATDGTSSRSGNGESQQ
jgi:type IV secretion system protein VirB8